MANRRLTHRFTVALLVALALLCLSASQYTPGGSASAPAPRLRLKTGWVDTEAPVALSTLAGQALVIVQFQGPVRDEWRLALEASGAVIHDYVPDYAYLVEPGAAAIETLRRLPGVRWVGPFLPAYKALARLGGYGAPREMIVQLVAGADLALATAQAEALGARVLEGFDTGLAAYLRAVVPPQAVAGLRALPLVTWIELAGSPAPDNNVARSYDVTAIDSVWDDLGLYGAGQIVAVADTGLDTGSLATLHPDFRGRLLQGYGWGRTGDWSDPSGHGTHVSGSVLGSGLMSDANPARRDYKYSYAGSAPEANLIIQSGYENADSSLGGLPTNLASLFDQAYWAGARIHSNSWSMRIDDVDPEDIYGVYSSPARQVDEYMWDHKLFLVVSSASNDGADRNEDGVVDPDSVKAPGTSKNGLCVGASENYRPEQSETWSDKWPNDYPVRPLSVDRMADDMLGMVAFSGRGPTDDGRIKPDIVTPGTYIISTHSQVAEGWGWGKVDDWYCYNSGTSMATPLTAGAAAVVRQYYVQVEREANPSAALIKATLLQGGRNLAPGQYGSGPCQEVPDAFPNGVIGHGRLNLRDSLAPWAPRVWAYDDETAGLRTDQYNTYEIDVLAPPQPRAEGSHTVALRRYPLGAQAPDEAREAIPAAIEAQLAASRAEGYAALAGAAPTAGIELIRNGGFEQGLANWGTQGWVETSSSAHTGRASLYLGAYDEASDVTWQTVYIPGDASDGMITFWLYQLSQEEVCGQYDWLWVGLADAANTNTTYSDIHMRDGMAVTTQWIQVTHRLTTEEIEDTRGKWVNLTLEIKTDDYGPTSWRIDDVSFQIARNGARLAPGALRAVLAWTDYPGALFADPSLVNDLDLIVIDPQGKEIYGNHKAELDGVNTVEDILLTAPVVGRYQIMVKGYNVPKGPQPYALTLSWEEQPIVRNNRRFVPVIKAP